MKDDDEPPFIDLHPSQWTHEKKREPFFGPSASHVLLMFILAFPVSVFAVSIVTGELPYWTIPLITGVAGVVGWPITIFLVASLICFAIWAVGGGILLSIRERLQRNRE